ncbi:MAG: TspO/MBR family protein [Patescibacteria group bacterium]
MNTKPKDFKKLIFSILLPLVVGGVSGLLTSSGVNGWYSTLEKPFLNPPSFVFGPVWTILYIMMGISLYLIWNSRESLAKPFLFWLFGLQLTANFFWSIFFFGMENPALALVDIVTLWILIVINIFYFYKVSRVAAWLLIPYLLWVSFATYLNLSIVTLN